ncbi:MAG: PTS sugar transporter subunit IIA [Thermodesulfobacteriota bacterium]
MKLADYLDLKTVISNLNSSTKEDVIKELTQSISKTHPNINYERLLELFMEREELCSTAVDFGVAVPHAKLSGITDIILGFGRSTAGISFGSLDKKPSHFFITLIAPEEASGVHIQLLARISKVFKNQELRSRLMQCETNEEILELIIDEDEKY